MVFRDKMPRKTIFLYAKNDYSGADSHFFRFIPVATDGASGTDSRRNGLRRPSLRAAPEVCIRRKKINSQFRIHNSQLRYKCESRAEYKYIHSCIVSDIFLLSQICKSVKNHEYL